MDKNIKYKQNYNGSAEKNRKDEEYKTDNQIPKIKESESNYRLKSNNSSQRTHSRSRSPCKNSKQWISSNAFINFVQDFRQNLTGVRSTKIFQIAGERWKKMPFEEKQPYIKAAMNIKNKKQNQQKIENINDVVNTNTEQPKNEDTQKQEKTGKRERKKREPKKSIKNKSNTESDNESISSGTTATNTSEDMSDTSS